MESISGNPRTVPMESSLSQPQIGEDAILEEPKTLDLHTGTALIGREDQDITLESLHLRQEAVNGTLDLYVVIRLLDSSRAVRTHLQNDVGLSEIYRFANHWVSPF